MDIGILLLRLAIGLTLTAHGTQKLFGWFGGGGLDKTGEGLAMLGFRPGRRHALAAGLVEVSAGVLLVAGLLTPLAAMLVGSLMLVAAISVHVKQGFFITSGGYEYNLVLGIAGLSLAFTGAGALSADALLGFDLSGVLWGIGASLLAVLGAAVQLAQRRTPAHAVTAA